MQLDMSRDQDLKDFFSETTKFATAPPHPVPPIVNNFNQPGLHQQGNNLNFPKPTQ
jgi:hypothetical protein